VSTGLTAAHFKVTPTEQELIREQFGAAKQLCASRAVEKVVLSQRRQAEGAVQLKVVSSEREIDHCSYLALWQNSDHSWLLSRTPEPLLKISGRDPTILESEAVGGTFFIAENTHSNLASASRADSEKLRREHSLISRSITAALSSQLQDPVAILSPFEELRLGDLGHFRSYIKGVLSETAALGSIVGRLHPTAATNGWPRELAQQVVAQIEQHDRGWYAGFMGVVSPDRCELVVNLRALLVSSGVVYAYAGCGILSDSVVEEELSELELKFASFLY
jgi:menaquinone-specific isochorismate synthase